MSWRPLFHNKFERGAILDKLQSIENILLSSNNVANPSLLTGGVGISLFWHYYFLLLRDPRHKEKSIEVMNAAMDSASSNKQPHTFCNGMSGIAWGIMHLHQLTESKVCYEDIVASEIDDFIIDRTKTDFSNGNYDFLHGGIGMLIYLIERIEKEKVFNALWNAASQMEKNSEKFGEGIAWRDTRNKDEINYDLGLAHGMPSIIVLLSRLYQNGMKDVFIKGMLEDSIRWVLSNKLDSESLLQFPPNISTGLPKKARLAWCYGDLGVAIALLQAGMIVGNEFWKQEAINIASNASYLRTPHQTGIMDACLCHGSSGVAHIFNRFFQYTGQTQFRDAAIFWYDKTIGFSNSTNGFKIFKSNPYNKELGWQSESGILEGLAGIGLALISSISEQEPKWDKCLLLS